MGEVAASSSSVGSLLGRFDGVELLTAHAAQEAQRLGQALRLPEREPLSRAHYRGQGTGPQIGSQQRWGLRSTAVLVSPRGGSGSAPPAGWLISTFRHRADIPLPEGGLGRMVLHEELKRCVDSSPSRRRIKITEPGGSTGVGAAADGGFADPEGVSRVLGAGDLVADFLRPCWSPRHSGFGCLSRCWTWVAGDVPASHLVASSAHPEQRSAHRRGPSMWLALII